MKTGIEAPPILSAEHSRKRRPHQIAWATTIVLAALPFAIIFAGDLFDFMTPAKDSAKPSPQATFGQDSGETDTREKRPLHGKILQVNAGGGMLIQVDESSEWFAGQTVFVKIDAIETQQYVDGDQFSHAVKYAGPHNYVSAMGAMLRVIGFDACAPIRWNDVHDRAKEPVQNRFAIADIFPTNSAAEDAAAKKRVARAEALSNATAKFWAEHPHATNFATP